MVCRENKSRSSSMGYAKALMRQAGFCDAEIQSMLHQVKHDGDALDKEAPFTREQQIDFVEHQIAAISADPRISDADKYRESVQRPGLVTRLEQELKRLKTGKDEHGNKLRPEQLNNASHQYTIMRMQNQLERMLPARQTFLETNARHRGISYEEAQAEWNELMKRKGHFEAKSRVRDDTRESLATAGIDEQTQKILGMSGRAMNTMEVMEQRRQDAVSRLEHTPTFNKETRQTTLKKPGKGYIQCGICGQFGHRDDECPNVDLAKRRDDMLGSIAQINHQDDVDNALRLADHVEEVKAKWNQETIEDVSGPWDDDLVEVRAVAVQHSTTVKDLINVANKEKNRLVEIGEWDDALDRAKLRANQEWRLAATMEKLNATGEHYNATIRAVDYSPETMALKIEHVDKDGNRLPPRLYRCTPDQAKDVTAMARNGADIDAISMAVLRHDENRFANTQVALAATAATKCPTCGKFTSLTSDHKCPVKGGPSGDQELERLRQRIEQRQAMREKLTNRKVGKEVCQDSYREVLVTKGDRGRRPWPTVSKNPADPDVLYAQYDVADSKAVGRGIDAGKAVVTPVRVAFSGSDPTDLGGVVTGKATVWRDKDAQCSFVSVTDTGLAVEEDFYGNMRSTTGVKCTCAAYKATKTCIHVGTTHRQLAGRYAAHPAPDGMLPGDQPMFRNRFSPDLQTMSNARRSVSALLRVNCTRIDDELERVRGLRHAGYETTVFMSEGPTYGDGKPAEWPTSFALQKTNDAGVNRTPKQMEMATDVRNTSDVTERARHLLSSEYVTWADGSKDRVRFSVSKARNRDGIVVSIPRKFRVASAGRQKKVRDALAERLGVPKNTVTTDGVYIPNDPASYHEFLDRAAGNAHSVRIFGPRQRIMPRRLSSRQPEYLTHKINDVDDIAVLRRARSAGLTVLIEGAPGAGKSALVHAAFGDTQITITCTGDTDVTALSGSSEDGGPISRAMREGRPLFLDNFPRLPIAVQEALLPLLDQQCGSHPRLPACEGFAVILSAVENERSRIIPGAHARIHCEIPLPPIDLSEKFSGDIDADFLHLARRLDQLNAGWVPTMRTLKIVSDVRFVLGLDFAMDRFMGACADQPLAVRNLVRSVLGTVFEIES